MADSCPECSRDYTRSRIPFVRSCGHTFCRECVIKQQQGRHPECPECLASRHSISETLVQPTTTLALVLRAHSNKDVPRTVAGNSQRQTGIPQIMKDSRKVDLQGSVKATLPSSIPHLRQPRPPEAHPGIPSDLPHGLQPCAKTSAREKEDREAEPPEDNLNRRLRSVSHKLREGSAERRGQKNGPSVNALKKRYEQLSHEMITPAHLPASMERVEGCRRHLLTPKVSRERPTSRPSTSKPLRPLKHLSKSTSELRDIHLVENNTSSSDRKRQNRPYGSRDDVNRVTTAEKTPAAFQKRHGSDERLPDTGKSLLKTRLAFTARRSSVHDLSDEPDGTRMLALKRHSSQVRLLDTDGESTAKLHAKRGSYGYLDTGNGRHFRTSRSSSISIPLEHGSITAPSHQSSSGKISIPSPASITHQQPNAATHDTQEGTKDAVGIHAARPVIIVDKRPDLPSLDDTWEVENDAVKALEDENAGLKNTISGLRTELKMVTQRKEEVEKLYSSTQAELTRVRNLTTKAESDERSWRRERVEMEQRVSTQNQHIDSLEREIRELRGPLPSGSVEEGLRQQLKELKAHLRIEQHNWIKERVARTQEINTLQQRLREQVLEDSSEEVGRLRDQLERRDREVSLLKSQLEDKEQEMRKYKVDMTKTSTALRSEAPVGLPNHGNTCYINSVLQCLFSIQALRLYFVKEQYMKVLNRESDQRGEVAEALGKVFKTLQTGTGTSTAISDFKRVVAAHDDVFLGQHQQEAHDLLSSLLLWLHNDLSETSRVQETSDHHTQTTSIISSIFHGLKESTIICQRTSKIVQTSSEVFDNLTLSVLDADDRPLRDLLKSHFEPREIDWDCQHCRRSHTCVHVTTLTNLPQVLLLHFSRYTGNSRKSSKKTRVVFPSDSLSLDKHLTSQTGYSPVYQLISVCNHHGTMASGHYTAFCRRHTGGSGWWLMDDIEVHPAGVKNVLGERDAHIVFYEAVQDSEV